MEVDHHDPRRERGKRQNYHRNLIAASRCCNGKKGEFWPTDEELAAGLYVIHPYEEIDYGVHLVEDAKTGKLKGLTPTGRWHITMLDLNADHLVLRRRLRTLLENKSLQAAGATSAKGREHEYQYLLAIIGSALKDLNLLMIPKLPTKATGKPAKKKAL